MTKSIIDEIREPFISLYNDIHDIVIGNDTSKYDGTPSTILETIYEETQYEIITLDDYVNEKNLTTNYSSSCSRCLNTIIRPLPITNQSIKHTRWIISFVSII